MEFVTPLFFILCAYGLYLAVLHMLVIPHQKGTAIAKIDAERNARAREADILRREEDEKEKREAARWELLFLKSRPFVVEAVLNSLEKSFPNNPEAQIHAIRTTNPCYLWDPQEWEKIPFEYSGSGGTDMVLGDGSFPEYLERSVRSRFRNRERENARKAAQQGKARKRHKEAQKEALWIAEISKTRQAARNVRFSLPIPSVCPYCGTPSDEWHADHIMPISLGGRSTLQNMTNICASCNLSKGEKTLRSFCRDKRFNFNEVADRLESQGKIV